MSVTQHFQESEKKSAVAVLMQLKSGGILEWYNYINLTSALSLSLS